MKLIRWNHSVTDSKCKVIQFIHKVNELTQLTIYIAHSCTHSHVTSIMEHNRKHYKYNRESFWEFSEAILDNNNSLLINKLNFIKIYMYATDNSDYIILLYMYSYGYNMLL